MNAKLNEFAYSIYFHTLKKQFCATENENLFLGILPYISYPASHLYILFKVSNQVWGFTPVISALVCQDSNWNFTVLSTLSYSLSQKHFLHFKLRFKRRLELVTLNTKQNRLYFWDGHGGGNKLFYFSYSLHKNRFNIATLSKSYAQILSQSVSGKSLDLSWKAVV